MAKTKLTTKQQRFADIYDGDLRETAKKVPISYIYAKKLYTSVSYQHIQEIIRKRETKRNGKDIADREERQKFWTDVMRGKETNELLPFMIKGSELLGRSEADFTENKHHTGSVKIIECDSVDIPDNAGTGK